LRTLEVREGPPNKYNFLQSFAVLQQNSVATRAKLSSNEGSQSRRSRDPCLHFTYSPLPHPSPLPPPLHGLLAFPPWRSVQWIWAPHCPHLLTHWQAYAHAPQPPAAVVISVDAPAAVAVAPGAEAGTSGEVLAHVCLRKACPLVSSPWGMACWLGPWVVCPQA